MKMNTLHDLLVHELRDLLYAEKKIARALPKMSKAVTNASLKEALDNHREETLKQIERLETIFDEIDVPARTAQCEGIEGILAEGEEMMSEGHDPAVMDAGLISSAQRIEHYEMAAYGCAKAYAEKLGYGHVAELLDQTLKEEEAADKALTRLAESGINAFATAGARESARDPHASEIAVPVDTHALSTK